MHLCTEMEVVRVVAVDVVLEEGQVEEVDVEVELILRILKVEDCSHSLVDHKQTTIGVVH